MTSDHGPSPRLSPASNHEHLTGARNRKGPPVTTIAEGSTPHSSLERARLIPIEAEHVAIVDAVDYEWVARYSWILLRGHNGKVYAHASITGGSLYMHRLIAGTPAGHETDHINGNGLDNRRANLRIATPSQNSANMWKPRRPDGSPHSSIYKGVTWGKGGRKWIAKITVAGHCKYLGSFTSEADAARAYDVAARDAWGDFARLNFPHGGEVAA